MQTLQEYKYAEQEATIPVSQKKTKKNHRREIKLTCFVGGGGDKRALKLFNLIISSDGHG